MSESSSMHERHRQRRRAAFARSAQTHRTAEAMHEEAAVRWEVMGDEARANAEAEKATEHRELAEWDQRRADEA
jgi:hypothetical protein